MHDQHVSDDTWLGTLPLLSDAQRRELGATFRRALIETPLPAVLCDLDGRVLGTNGQLEQLWGADEADLHGRHVGDLVHPDDRPLTEAIMERLSRGISTVEKYEARWIRPDGRVVWARRHIARVDGPNGDETSYFVGVLEDLTHVRFTQQLAATLMEIGTGIAAGAPLGDTAERLTDLVEARWSEVGLTLTVLDEHRNVLMPVPHSRAPMGLYDGTRGVPVGEAGAACGMAAWRDEPVAMPDMLNDERTAHMRPVLSEYGIVAAMSVPLHDPDGKVIGTLGVFYPHRHEPDDEDWATLQSVAGVAAIGIIVDKRRRALAEEQQRVRTDARTGLLNEVALLERIDEMLAAGSSVSVAVASLLGPASLTTSDGVTNLALIQLAKRARSLGGVREVAVSGMTSLAVVAAAEWSEREAELLHRVLSRPTRVRAIVAHPEIAVGVATTGTDVPMLSAELLTCATIAAPQHSGCRVFEADEPEAVLEHGLGAEVPRALRHGEFVIHYQPQFDLVSGELVGSEALVRWEHPVRGLLPPAAFLPAIESIGASTELAFTVIRLVRADVERRIEVGLSGRVSVNLTAGDLLNQSLLHVLRNPDDQLWNYIGIELTESQFARPETISALDDLAAVGYSIALDDFGTGYSALAALHTLPLSTVKIDRSFVERLPHDASADALIAAITALCNQLEITVVAEGIETPAQSLALQTIGCHVGQGFLFSPPQPLAEHGPLTLNPQVPEPSRSQPRILSRVSEAARHRLRELHEDGASVHTIAAALNHEGHRVGPGTRWHARSVQAVLNALIES